MGDLMGGAALRADLPRPIPEGIEALPRDHRGFPVPYFAQRDPIDFRVVRRGVLGACIKRGLCWVCGRQRAEGDSAFVLGPMCGVTRTAPEPPSHVACAMWSARACPFLVRPGMRRNEVGLPADAQDAPGVPLKRNPGVALVWASTTWAPWKPPGGGILFDVGDPVAVAWFREGRPALRAEVEDSIRTGLPALEDMAQQDGPAAVIDLALRLASLDAILPA